MKSDNPPVQLDHVSKNYGSLKAVRDVSLKMAQGELITLLGPSGCGKSTMLRMIAGFVQPSAGDIYIGGSLVSGLPPHKRHVGLVFQNYALFPHMTVSENVAFGLKMRGITGEASHVRVREALERVRLDQKLDAYPRQLSGGQQQRTALARALVITPQVLLLDEPFGALDRELRQHMQSEMRLLQRSIGISTLLVTHDQEEALTLSDRIVVMNAGAVEQIDTPINIFERPKTAFVAQFMGRANIFPGNLSLSREEQKCVVTLDALPIKLNAMVQPEKQAGPVSVMIRPERIEINPPSSRITSSSTEITSNVLDVSYLGSFVEIKLGINDSSTDALVIRAPATGADRPSINIGDTVTAAIPPEAVHII